MLYTRHVNVCGRKCMLVHHRSTSVGQIDSTTAAYVPVYGIKEE